jgi:Pyruvate/2-oxoacid:ferredoxin oxidoreductase delta subunit
MMSSRENEMLKMELSRLNGKGHVQPSQDNRDHMVKKLEKGSTITCDKLPQINLKTSYQKVDQPKIKKNAQVKCFECSTLGYFSSECPNKKVIEQSPLEDKEAYLREGALDAKKKATI